MRAHWISTVRVAFTALKTNRVRSALTMLGIVIGVAAVIATVAVGTGASQRVQAQIASIGSNMVIIIPGSLTSSGLQLGTGSATTLSYTLTIAAESASTPEPSSLILLATGSFCLLSAIRIRNGVRTTLISIEPRSGAVSRPRVSLPRC